MAKSSNSGLALAVPPSGQLAHPAPGRVRTTFAAPTPSSYSTAPAALPEETVTVISLADLIRYVRRRWLLGLMLALPLAVAIFAWLGLGTKIYEAEAHILLRIQDANVFNFTEMTHSGSSEISAPMLINDHKAELVARRYMEFLYAKLPQADRDAFVAPELAPKPKGLFDFLNGSDASKPKLTDPKEIFIRKLAANTRVDLLKESHILKILLRDQDPTLAARLANAYAQEYISYVTQQDLNVSKAASEFLERKGEELQKRLQESERKLSSFRSAENLVDSNADTKDISGEKTRLLTQALAAAELKLTSLRQGLETIRQAQASGLDLLQIKAVGDNADVGALKRQLETCQAELANMRVLLGNRHPKVQEKNRQIETLNSQLKLAIQNVVSTNTSEEANSNREVEELRKQLEAAKKDLLSQGGKNAQQNLLRDQVAIDRELYQKIKVRTDQAHLTGDFADNGGLRLEDIAATPDKPVKPSKPIALLASLVVFSLVFAGLPIGLGLAGDHLVPLLKDQPSQSRVTSTVATETTMASASTALSVLPGPADALAAQLPVLAQIPDLPLSSPPELLAALLSDATTVNTTIGHLCGSLVHCSPPAPGPRILLLLSAERSEGRTLMASTLAGFLTMNSQRVMLMDCNPDAPAVHRWFRLAGNHSSGASDLNSLRYSNSSLYVLPAHDLPSYDFNELVSGYTAWIGRAQSQVDWIIIDGPSVLRNYADALALLPLATDIVMVHDPSRTTFDKFKGALNLLLPRVDASLFRGVVMNRQKM